ncbi:hypothetical protein [Streptomyces zhihengii]|uniref:hypothetical protein n=1 Tax=Streptomyces zhihengii TaxID=1818004 RepID=UPI0033B6E73A
MIYNFLTVRRLSPRAMAQTLAVVVGVAEADVDVADTGAGEDHRDWDAPVICGYHTVDGDLALSWDVYVTDAVPAPPDEAGAALRIAELSGTTVLYPAAGARPSAYWAAAPDGTVTRVRVREGDDDRAGPVLLSVDAAEAPLTQLPSARVELLPEVYWDETVPTPVADAFAAAADPGDTAPAGSIRRRARDVLTVWERLARRAEADWAPSGRYPHELYLHDLTARDDLAELLAGAGLGDDAALLAKAVDELDAAFRTGTRDDDGVLLGGITRSGTAVLTRGWWWHRRPLRLPWEGGGS